VNEIVEEKHVVIERLPAQSEDRAGEQTACRKVPHPPTRCIIHTNHHVFIIRLQKHETKITKANKKIEADSDKYNDKVKAMREKIYRKYAKSDYDGVLAAYTDLKEKISR